MAAYPSHYFAGVPPPTPCALILFTRVLKWGKKAKNNCLFLLSVALFVLVLLLSLAFRRPLCLILLFSLPFVALCFILQLLLAFRRSICFIFAAFPCFLSPSLPYFAAFPCLSSPSFILQLLLAFRRPLSYFAAFPCSSSHSDILKLPSRPYSLILFPSIASQVGKKGWENDCLVLSFHLYLRHNHHSLTRSPPQLIPSTPYSLILFTFIIFRISKEGWENDRHAYLFSLYLSHSLKRSLQRHLLSTSYCRMLFS